MNKSEINALIKLLEDPDRSVYNAVKSRLTEIGSNILTELKTAWEESNNDLFLERSSEIISTVQFNQTFDLFKAWVKSDDPNLLEGAFLITSYKFPELDKDIILQKVEKIKRDAWLQMNDNLTPLEQIRVLNHIIYNIHKFVRNNMDFYSPKNSYLNLVLETKKGNPVSLAILYLVVANKLGLPVYGVNLPKNFILAYVEEHSGTNLKTALEDKIVSFYINPYNNGAILTKREIDYFLKQQKIKSLDYFYTPCDNHTIIQRLILNLIYAYERQEDFSKSEDLKKFLSLFKKQLPNNNI